MKQWNVGKRVAPARFVIFFVMLGTSIALATIAEPWWRSVMLGFDLSSLVFMASCIKLYKAEPSRMRQVAVDNDANRAVLLFLVFALGIVILVAVGSEMTSAKNSALDAAVTIATLLIAWFFGNTVYALHYSHLFYTANDGGKDRAGLEFAGGNKLPTFSDFVYFAFTVGSALAVSDTKITSPHIRRIATAHSVVAFIFNVGVFALTVNMLAGKG